jgi:putative phosphoesterase
MSVAVFRGSEGKPSRGAAGSDASFEANSRDESLRSQHTRGDQPRSIVMKLGLISDIHADARALETALGYLDELGVERTLCAGDLVGYGSQPDDAIAMIRERSIPVIRGNHDRWALERRQVVGPRGWKPAEMNDRSWEFLRSLPAELRVELAGRTIIVHHGSPTSDTEFVSPYKPLPPSVAQFWDTEPGVVLILGHTHLPMIERTERGTIINPGSVMGVPGVQTSYSFAVVELETLEVRFYEVRTGREFRRDPIYVDEF